MPYSHLTNGFLRERIQNWKFLCRIQIRELDANVDLEAEQLALLLLYYWCRTHLVKSPHF